MVLQLRRSCPCLRLRYVNAEWRSEGSDDQASPGIQVEQAWPSCMDLETPAHSSVTRDNNGAPSRGKVRKQGDRMPSTCETPARSSERMFRCRRGGATEHPIPSAER